MTGDDTDLEGEMQDRTVVRHLLQFFFPFDAHMLVTCLAASAMVPSASPRGFFAAQPAVRFAQPARCAVAEKPPVTEPMQSSEFPAIFEKVEGSLEAVRKNPQAVY